MTDREQFHARRKLCVGGSDAADLLDLAPFGCSRKLWFDKKSVSEDFPFDENYHVRRGSAIEPVAILEFSREFSVTIFPSGHITIPGTEYIGCHLDGLILKSADCPQDEAGVLEIKIPASRNFAKIKQSGQAPMSWQVQAQWGMMVSGLHWAEIGVFNTDLFKIIKFPVEEDLALQADMKTVAASFWESLVLEENPFPKLPDGDSRCYDCQWRKTCKGLGRTFADVTGREKVDILNRKFAVNDSAHLLNLVDEYIAAKAEHNEAEKFAKDLKEELQELIGAGVELADGRKVFPHEQLVQMKAKEAYTQRRISIKVLDP